MWGFSSDALDNLYFGAHGGHLREQDFIYKFDINTMGLSAYYIFLFVIGGIFALWGLLMIFMCCCDICDCVEERRDSPASRNVKLIV